MKKQDLLKFRFVRFLNLIRFKIKFQINKVEAIKALENAYEGESCFIVGNGPSLRIEDLNGIKDFYSFGVNRIFEVYDKTVWRPSFYCIQDIKLIQELNEKLEIPFSQSKYSFYPVIMKKKINNKLFKNNVIGFNLDFFELKKGNIHFSKDASKRIFEGATVTYACLQLAAYMGFKKIYLIGVDCNYSIALQLNGEIVENKNVSNYTEVIKTHDLANIPQTEKSILAYTAAKEFCDKNGIEIYNATRGGKLEVFNRMNFEEILSGKTHEK